MATTQDYINQLKKDKQNLVAMLNTMGVEASSNETFTSLTPKVGTIVTDPILQDKTIEITENSTTNIVADANYDGLNSVEVTVNVASTPVETNESQHVSFMKLGTFVGTPPNYLNTANISRGTYLGFDIKIRPGQTYRVIGQSTYEYRILQVDETLATAIQNGQTTSDTAYIGDTGWTGKYNYTFEGVENVAYAWIVCRNPKNIEQKVDLEKALPVYVEIVE